MDPQPWLAPTWSDPRLALCRFGLRGYEPPPRVSFVTQVHGADSVAISSPASASSDVLPPDPPAGDALWTTSRGVPVSIRTADCVPILLWDPEAHAVAAVHAGWRGTAQDIVGRTLAFAGDRLGVDPSRVLAAIGPCISRDRFEVGPEVVDALRALEVPDEVLRVATGPRGRPHVDLRSVNRALLTRAGVPDGQIEDVGGCTYSEPERYESYRRDGGASGRMWAIIALAGAG